MCFMTFIAFVDFCSIWHLRGFCNMENTLTVRADDLPSILGILKQDPKSRSVNDFLQQLDFDPNSITVIFVASQSSAQ